MRFILLTLIMGIFSACSIFKDSTEEKVESDCSQRVTIVSYANVPGCQFLLQLEDGTKLQAVEGLRGAGSISEGAEAMIDYEIAEGTRSMCRETDKVVRLTCIDVLTFPEQECADKTTVFKRNWFGDSRSYSKATVLRYHPTDSLNYFRLEGERSMIFNCYGHLECMGDNYSPGTRCDKLVNLFENAEIIWTENQ